MTDDERISQIERICHSMHDRLSVVMPLGTMTMPVSDIDLLLRVIRDQRAELAQARQAIANMRRPIDGN